MYICDCPARDGKSVNDSPTVSVTWKWKWKRSGEIVGGELILFYQFIANTNISEEICLKQHHKQDLIN